VIPKKRKFNLKKVISEKGIYLIKKEMEE